MIGLYSMIRLYSIKKLLNVRSICILFIVSSRDNLDIFYFFIPIANVLVIWKFIQYFRFPLPIIIRNVLLKKEFEYIKNVKYRG